MLITYCTCGSSNFANAVRIKLFCIFSCRPKVPNILEIVDVNGKNVLWVLDKLDDGSELSKKFNAIFMSLKRGMTEIPSGNPTTLPLPFIRRLLSPQGDGSVTGGIADVATQLTVAVENSKLHVHIKESKKISNDQELIQSDPTSCPQNQQGNK